jgi:hypothetical protein
MHYNIYLEAPKRLTIMPERHKCMQIYALQPKSVPDIEMTFDLD